MKCWRCGAELKGSMRFCSNCGADQQAAPQAPSWDQETQPMPPSPPAGGGTYGGEPYGGGGSYEGGSPSGGSPAGGNEIVLKVFAAICAVIYGVAAVRGLIGLVRSLLSIFGIFSGISTLISLVIGLLVVVLDVLMCLVLVMFILKREQNNTGGLMVLLGIGGIGIAAVQLIRMIFRLISSGGYMFGTYFGQFVQAVIGAAVVIAGVYAILRFVLGEDPLLGKSQEELSQEISNALNCLGKTASEAAQGAKSSWSSAQQSRQAQQQWQAQQQAQWQGQPGPGVPPPPGGYAVARLKADRSLLAYILLTLITCGIYSWYFIYALARDVNVACAGDGKQTAGLVKFILLSLITCGIYSFIWYYGLGNRLAANAPRYGMNFQENGTTVLLWLFFGSLLCGIGPFIALHIIIKNANQLCGAYNYQHGI